MSNTTAEQLYTTGAYLEKNPLWHTEESSWKAEHVMRMISWHNLIVGTLCEIGCGAGDVLNQLQQRFTKDCDFVGCDISPHAIELCRSRANSKLHFELGDVTTISNRFFDLVLVLDVIEHLEDYFPFCERLSNERSTRSFTYHWICRFKRFYALTR